MRACLIVFGLLVSAAASMPAQAGPLESLAWLSGCWAKQPGEAGSGEYWLPMAGGSMLGIGRTVQNGRTADYEFLRLEEDARGRAIYTASPSGQKETSFVAIALDDDSATFENAIHDFPQRIIYRRISKRKMTVRIEGDQKGKARGADFHFEKVACSR